MRKAPERNISWLFIAIAAVSALGWLIRTYPPSPWYRIILFFILVFIAVFFLFRFVLNNVRRATLIGNGAVLVLFLRLLDLRELTYILLLAALLLSLELYLKKR